VQDSWNCVPKNRAVPFSIPLRAHGTEFVAEFQRRTGSQMLFSKLFSETLSGLSQDDFFSKSTSTNQFSDISALSGGAAAEPLNSEMSDAGLDETSVFQIIEMAKSDFLDVRVEALRIVNSLLAPNVVQKLHETAHAINSQLLPEMLHGNCKSTDDDVRWLSICIVAKLSTIPEFCAAAASLVPTLNRLFSLPNTLVNRDVIRQAAIALELITRKTGRVFQ